MIDRLIRRDSPLFIDLLIWLKRKNFKIIGEVFPLNIWMGNKNKKFHVNLAEQREKIKSKLIEPLFIKAGVNVKDEDDISRHRKDNLICCFEFFLKKLKRMQGSGGEFERVMEEFRSCYEKVIATAKPKASVYFPYSWMLDSKQNISLYRIRQDRDALKDRKDSIERAMNDLEEGSHIEKIKVEAWNRITEELANIEANLWKHEFMNNEKINSAVRFIEFDLNWLKMARGKPGRHPKPFNVFAYHMINEFTRRKIDKDGKYVKRKDGQHRLERYWEFILFFCLYTHFHMKELPEIKRFIIKNKNKPARDALRILKNMLWNAYKNFPPLEGWPFPRKQYETGFRKLIVKDDGSLKTIWL